MRRILRLAGAAGAVSVAIGIIRALRPPAKPAAGGTASWAQPAERADPPPRQGPVRFAEPAGPEPAETEPAETEPSEPEPSAGDAAAGTADAARWQAPVDGECPHGFLLKVAAGSEIFHAPGGAFYERTVPERCYATPEDAVADGLRAAKR